MGTDKVIFVRVQWGATGSHVTGNDVTGSNVTGSRVTGRDPVRNRKYVAQYLLVGPFHRKSRDRKRPCPEAALIGSDRVRMRS